ncbi:MAG: asparagine synthase-related protein [Victivallaceae bacterium]
MIAGILIRKTSSLNLNKYKDIAANTLNQFETADQTGYYSNDNALLVQCTRRNAPGSGKEPVPYINNETNIVVLFWGRLTNREELGKTFELSTQELIKVCDSELIHRSYIKWGNSLTEHLYGDYSAAVYDIKENNLLCFVDHMAVKPFYYYCDDKIFVFSSTLTLFHKLKLFPVNPDMEWAAKYMLHLSMDFEKTAYADVYKLPPAHQLEIDGNKAEKKKYFSFNETYHLENVSIEECLEQYLELLNHAVSARIDSDYPVGSETSGGVDSSTMTAFAAKNLNQPIENLYAFGFATLAHEPDYILQTSQMYKTENNFICCSNSSAENDETIDESLDALGYPVEHGNATFHTPFYKECRKNNIRTLLSGFGGDEFVTSIHSDIALKELLADKKYKELYSKLPGNKPTAFLRLLKMYYKFKYSAPAEYNERFLNTWKIRWPYFSVNEKLVKHYDLKKKYFDTAKFDAGYANLNKFTIEGRFRPFVPTRMNNCTNMAYAYGIDYAWPLLDVKLIEFFLSVPTEFKYSREMGRYFHRKAVENFVPEGVNWKQGKDMGEPFIDKTLRDIPEVDKDLHENIFDIADINKIKSDVEKLNSQQRKDAQLAMPARKTVMAVNTLNKWLYKFYPDGCNWKNTP